MFLYVECMQFLKILNLSIKMQASLCLHFLIYGGPWNQITGEQGTIFLHMWVSHHGIARPRV